MATPRGGLLEIEGFIVEGEALEAVGGTADELAGIGSVTTTIIYYLEY